MRDFLRTRHREVLLTLITAAAITKWWVPSLSGFEKMYAASQWVLSYDHGLVRRGLVGTIMSVWSPVVTIEAIRLTAFIVYGIFVLLLLVALFLLVRHKDPDGRLFPVVLVFLSAPVTLSLLARDLGRFDLFLIVATFFAMALLWSNKHLWLVPILLVVAMFIHEGFAVLYAPTVLSAMYVLHVRNGGGKKMLATLVASLLCVAGAFVVLYFYGRPSMGIDELSRVLQSRAAFSVTPLSISECYYSITDHYALASSSLYDPWSIANFLLALLMLSPVALLLLDLWSRMWKTGGVLRTELLIFFVATFSGMALVPIATDYGRWLSAVVFCNFFAVFFLIGKGVLRVQELTEYAGHSFPLLVEYIVLVYLLFGPFHDWNPYPYQDNIIVSSLSIISVLVFDVGFFFWRRSLK